MKENSEFNLITQAVVKRVNKLLAEKNMTLYRLERNSGILHGTMSSLMRGKTKDISFSLVVLLAHGFNMGVIEFLDDPLFKYEHLNV